MGKNQTARNLTPLILLVAFTLRTVGVATRPLWYDEAIAILHASVSPSQLLYGTVTPIQGAGAANVHPPLYFLLLHCWVGLAGRSPLAVRFLSVVLGVTTVALLCRLTSRFFGRRTALVTGLLAATNPFHVAYSQETRMYALLALTAVASTWGLLRALEERRPRWWALYVAAATLMLYTQNLGAFVLLALNLLVLTRRAWRRHLSTLILADAIVAALFGPWLIGVLPGQLDFVGRGYWLSPPGAAELVRAVMLPILTFYEPPSSWLLMPGLFTGLFLLAVLLLRARKAPSRAVWFLFLAWAPILLLFLVSLWQPLYLERALLPSALLYLVAVGWLLMDGGLPGLLRLSMAALLLLTTVGTLGAHYTYVGFPRPPFPDAVEYLRTRMQPGDAIVHTNKLTYVPMEVYDPGLAGAFLADPPGSPQDTLALPTQEALGIHATDTITTAVGTARRVWLVYFSRELDEMAAAGIEHPVVTWMDDHFAATDRQLFADLVITLYQREGP